MDNRYNEIFNKVKNNPDLSWKLLGSQILKNASPRFFQYSIMEAFHISPEEWENIPVPRRAEMMIYLDMKGKLDFLERYEQEIYHDAKRKTEGNGG